jgi:hypothetical protein
LLSLGALALLSAHLRIEQRRSAARALRIESEWVALRHERWEWQVKTARTRSPERVRDRLQTWQVSLVPPEEDRAELTSLRLTADRTFE